MKKTILITIHILYNITLQAQDTAQMSLTQVIETANQKSLDAFRAKNMYLASYWQYKSFRANQLPSVSLNLAPVDFRRTMTKRYNSTDNRDEFREQKTMENYARLAVTQNIPVLGGELYVDTDLSRLLNYSDSNNIPNYSATWLRIGVTQPLFGFNSLKWEKKISPLKFEIAKKEYLQTQQEIQLRAVELYFGLLLAGIQEDIAVYNYATSDTLLQLGEKKKEILAISQDELLNLQLNKFNAEVDIVKAKQQKEKALFNLNSFLGNDKNTIIRTEIPEIKDAAIISPDEAVDIAKKNSPSMLELEQRKLEADRALDRAIKESRFNANVTASFGLNQNAEKLPDAYINPLDQQVVSIGLQIPLLDWGRSRGQKQMAQKNKEVTYIEAKKTLSDFEQSVMMKTLDFNLQPSLVESAKKAQEIAELSFNLTKTRFKLGKADVMRLNNAMQSRQTSKEKYVNSIYTYWRYYYELQKLTLYDLKNKKNVEEDFDKIIEND